MQFKAYCQQQPKDSIVVEHIGTDEVYIECNDNTDYLTCAVVLSKKMRSHLQALSLTTTRLNRSETSESTPA